MDIGKIIKIHDIPRPIPVKDWPEKEEGEKGIEVPNWPKREKERVEEEVGE